MASSTTPVTPTKPTEPTALDKAAVNYSAIYDALESGIPSGAFNFRVSAEIFNTSQVLEIYLNRLIAVEKKVKDSPIPAEPKITAKDALTQLNKLFEAFEMAQAKGAYKVQKCVNIAQHFAELRTYISKREDEDAETARKAAADAEKLKAAAAATPAAAEDNIAKQ